ncbi:MAG: hypothetical protein AXW12_14040 [Thalassospira sp. Nap_22]|nr:MAG: hypothetical protein AXW12_14040 [Thalassospira sp. Nap_22]
MEKFWYLHDFYSEGSIAMRIGENQHTENGSKQPDRASGHHATATDKPVLVMGVSASRCEPDRHCPLSLGT